MLDSPRGPAARPLRVVLTGSESTGKTDLATWLAAELGVPGSAEYARAYALARGGSAALTAADVEPIALGQRAGEDAAIAMAVAQGARVVVHDTDLLSTFVYATQYYGASAVPGWLSEALAARMPDLYLLCDIDLPWHGDPVRDSTADRTAVQGAFERALGEHAVGVPVVRVSGDREARRGVAECAVGRLLAGGGDG